jgi:hypothetical protein
MTKLKQDQEWIQAVITHPQGVEKGAQAIATETIESVIAPSQTLTSEQRINIYHNAYYARLFECFKTEYKGLLNALGDPLFEHLVWAYLQQHPSTSYTLYDLGKAFPQFLADSLKHLPADQQPEWWQQFIIDLTTFERYFTETFNGEGHEELRSNGTEWKQSPALRLLHLQFPIAECIGKFREGDATGFPEVNPTYYTFARMNYRVTVFPVSESEWQALTEKLFPQEFIEKWEYDGFIYR